MKTLLKTVGFVFLVAISVMSCHQDEPTLKPIDSSDDRAVPPEEDITEIARLEKEEGITFFKKDVVFESGDSKAILTIATRNEIIFKNVVEKFIVNIQPIYKSDILTNSNGAPAASGTKESSIEDLEGEEILTEFSYMQRGNDVIGFKTSLEIPESSNARALDISGYPAYVTYTSSNWPNRFWLDLPASGAGLYMQAKWKWYNSWSSNTIYSLTNCAAVTYGQANHSWDLWGGCYYLWDVDGPYRCRAKIGYFDSYWSWGFTYG